ncbi:hypothetical protein ABMA27_002383 [Loxostege sticticalis]|uniref:Uncharacterized protein n=1 Tax=Loxostege sticticalis TaxID=481309 RepID=A0ABR3HTF2_LOXSC
MFWSGNYIAVRELNFLLKEENVTLTQVLEADDILQECKADNKALMQFLTKPKILAELITLITEEPPKNVELASQYRHASIACEVLTSHLSSLSDRLSMDVAQMNRLCDFINKDPPLNPLLASYFSKTVEMLLERSPKQDWYLYHIVCLRVLDFFKSRRDFLPNLLRHISTSAIADTFKYFIRLDDLFNKIIMEWFEEHQFLECLIQIVCGTYAPEPAGKQPAPSPDRPEKGQQDLSEKGNQPDGLPADTGTESVENNVAEAEEAKAAEKGAEARADSAAEAERASRIQAVASANAAALLCDLILSGCAGEGCNTRPRTSWALVSRLQSAEGVRLLLQGMFTAPPRSRPHALVHGAHVLLALLDQEPILGGECESERTSVELAVAPHLPLLHQALLEEPGSGRVGLPRVQVAALLAHLALSEVEEVATTMLTLGTPGVLVEMMFAHPNNNFLHAQVYALVKHALGNRAGLLARLMDAFEHNEAKQGASARAGYMGHVVLALRRVGKALEDDAVLALLPPEQAQRWQDFREGQLAPVLQRHDKPLGGFYPSENIYEANDINDINADAYNEMCTNDSADFLADELDLEDGEKGEGSKNNFLELASQRFDDDMWEDTPEADAEQEAEAEGEDEGEVPLSRVRELLEQHSPWESSSSGGGGGEGWAQFEAFASAPAHAHAHAATPSDPFAPQGNPSDQFAAFWSYTDAQDKTADEKMEESMRALRLDDGGMCSVELASKLLSCMSNMMLPQHTGTTLMDTILGAGDAGAAARRRRHVQLAGASAAPGAAAGGALRRRAPPAAPTPDAQIACFGRK